MNESSTRYRRMVLIHKDMGKSVHLRKRRRSQKNAKIHIIQCSIFFKIGHEAYLENKTNTHFFLMPSLPSLTYLTL